MPWCYVHRQTNQATFWPARYGMSTEHSNHCDNLLLWHFDPVTFYYCDTLPHIRYVHVTNIHPYSKWTFTVLGYPHFFYRKTFKLFLDSIKIFFPLFPFHMYSTCLIIVQEQLHDYPSTVHMEGKYLNRPKIYTDYCQWTAKHKQRKEYLIFFQGIAQKFSFYYPETGWGSSDYCQWIAGPGRPEIYFLDKDN